MQYIWFATITRMMQVFTSLNNPIVEASLQAQMRIIVDEIIRVYGSDCTVILAGSFGRGEGSVKMETGKPPVPLNDFDVYVITDRRVEPSFHREMEQKILRDLSQLTGSELVRDKFVVGVETVDRRSLARLLPDISAYEMKAASQVLHGPDVRGLIPVTSRNIALASGAITLYHRTIALLENVEPEYLDSKQYPDEKRLETVRETCKTYTEICTSLSLLGGFYRPSYRARAQEFQKHSSQFPELVRLIPDLPEKVAKKTEMKISSDFSSIIDEAPTKWLEARRDLAICHRYFLSRMLGTEFNQPWTSFCRESERKLKWIFFFEYLSFILKQRGIHGSPFVYGANVLFQAYDSYSFNRRIREFGRVPANTLLSLTSPLQSIYLATVSTLYALRDDGTIDEKLLSEGTGYLEKVFKTSDLKVDAPELWKLTRDNCLEAQKLYFIREQKRVF
jgi:hypothetical protein